MRIALFGISCVGKTTVGQIMADALGYSFVDFDHEVIARMDTTITALKDDCGTERRYRRRVRHILRQILSEHQDNLVLAMPPSGLFPEYAMVFHRHPDVVTVWLSDKAKNIFKRLIFTDDDDKLIEEQVITAENAWYYMADVKRSIAGYRDTLEKAQLRFKIKGRSAKETADALIEVLLLKPGASIGVRSMPEHRIL